MRRIALRLCVALGLASICVGSAYLGSTLALEHLAAGSLPVDLRSELEVDYHGEEAPSYLPPLEPSVSEQALEDEALLSAQFAQQDLELVPVFSSQPDWQAVPTPGWLLTPQATASADESPAESTPVPGVEPASEDSTPTGSSRKTFVERYGPYPDADTFIAEDASTADYSSADELVVSSSAGHRGRVLLNIKPVGLTGSGTLERAVLHIYVASSVGAGESVTVHRVTAPWDPAGATWESVSGGQFEAEPKAGINITSAGWKVVDLTAVMREWLEGSAESYGVILMAPAAGDDVTAAFYSSNHPDPLMRPWLEVTFISSGDR